MKELFFDIYGISLQVSLQALEWNEFFFSQLLADFSYFYIETRESKPSIQVLVSNAVPISKESGVPWFRTKLCIASQNGSKRICHFHDGSILEDTGLQNRKAKLFVKTKEAGYEALYYYLLSSIGEALDRKGLHRMHAVAYEQEPGANCLPLDSKQGKTTRALRLLVWSEQRLFGDEIVLTDGVQLYPFPIRLAVRPDVYEEFRVVPAEVFQRSLGGQKFLVTIPRSRVAAPTENFRLLFTGAKFFSLFHFSKNFLLGLGLPQMREFMLRPNAIFSLSKIAFLRVRCFVKLVRKMQVTDKNSP
jgi:hypothetical protein